MFSLNSKVCLCQPKILRANIQNILRLSFKLKAIKKSKLHQSPGLDFFSSVQTKASKCANVRIYPAKKLTAVLTQYITVPIWSCKQKYQHQIIKIQLFKKQTNLEFTTKTMN